MTLLSGALAAVARSSKEPKDEFVLSGWLGRRWTNERVRFRISELSAAKVVGNTSLVDGRGEPVPFEIVVGPGGTSIEFIANLGEFERQVYRLQKRDTLQSSDLRVEQSPLEISIYNGKSGVAVRTALAAGQGPFSKIRLSDGAWSDISMTVQGGIVEYSATLVRHGPVVATVVAKCRFADGPTWELQVSIQAGDSAVQVEETWSDWNHSAYELNFGSQLPAARLFFRKGSGGDVGMVAINEANGKEVDFDLVPWLHWWLSELRGNWLAAFSEASRNALVAAAIRPDEWLAEADAAKQRTLHPIKVTLKDGVATLRFPIEGARRVWLLAVLPRSDAIDMSMLGRNIAPMPQQLVIKHGDFPLDEVKDYVLD